MHSIGKLIRGKREPSNEPSNDVGGRSSTRGKLTFDAEAVIETCAFDAYTVNTFIQHNVVSGTVFSGPHD